MTPVQAQAGLGPEPFQLQLLELKHIFVDIAPLTAVIIGSMRLAEQAEPTPVG